MVQNFNWPTKKQLITIKNEDTTASNLSNTDFSTTQYTLATSIQPETSTNIVETMAENLTSTIRNLTTENLETTTTTPTTLETVDTSTEILENISSTIRQVFTEAAAPNATISNASSTHPDISRDLLVTMKTNVTSYLQTTIPTSQATLKTENHPDGSRDMVVKIQENFNSTIRSVLNNSLKSTTPKFDTTTPGTLDIQVNTVEQTVIITKENSDTITSTIKSLTNVTEMLNSTSTSTTMKQEEDFTFYIIVGVTLGALLIAFLVLLVYCRKVKKGRLSHNRGDYYVSHSVSSSNQSEDLDKSIVNVKF